MYYLLSASYINILEQENVLLKCEPSKIYMGYYVPEHIYLQLKNKNLI
jgi:arginyl-tRNA--protein-N-Asp/Glu arginylyltransferase